MTGDQDQTLELLQRWHDGDREALASLVEQERAWIEDRVRSRRGPALRRHAETVDDFQDLMLRALQFAPRFLCANRAQFRGLLARMIENLLIDKSRHLSARRPEQQLESAFADSRLSLDPSVKSATQPGEAAARAEAIAWMRLGLEFLSEEERALIRKRQFEDRSFTDIAAEESVAPDAVRMRFNRALLRLASVVQRLQGGGVEVLLAEADGR